MERGKRTKLEADWLYRNQGNGMFTEVALFSGVAVDETGSAYSSMAAVFAANHKSKKLKKRGKLLLA